MGDRDETYDKGSMDSPAADKSPKRRFREYDRTLSWILSFITFMAIVTGYILTRTESQAVPVAFHVIIAIAFAVLLAFHIFTYTFLVKYNWRYGISKILEGKSTTKSFAIFVLRVSGIILLLSGIFVFVSGLEYYIVLIEPFSLSNHVIADNIFYLAFSVHVAAGLKLLLSRRKKPRIVQNLSSVVLFTGLIIVFFAFESGFVYDLTEEPGNLVQVDGVAYSVDSNMMPQLRPDIFQEKSHSMFDALVLAAGENGLGLKYHYDAEMETHVIDSFKGSRDWWYEAYYDGGYTAIPAGETNFQRMDEYPWKEGAILRMLRVDSSEPEKRYDIFKTEVRRKQKNEGKVIVPRVIIEGKGRIQDYSNIEVLAHNLRNDTFRDGTVTAIDTILTLGDLGYIDYDLVWYESIGTAEIVKSYFIEGIDGDFRHGRCGFVYESGEPGYEFFSGNHIHIPSDWRVLKSPEYVKYFWICI